MFSAPLDLVKRVCLILYETAKLSSKAAVPDHYVFLLAVNESSCCSTSLPAFNVSVTNFGHSNRCIVVSHCCFKLHLPDD